MKGQFNKPKPLLIASLIVTLATVGMTYQPVQAGLQALDFNCYEPTSFTPFFEATEITLIDQFGETSHTTGNFVEFCASANKVTQHGSFFDPFQLEHHFTCYEIDGAAPDVLVELTDQFGTFRHTVGDAREVCVPATKITNQPAEFPPLLNNHWKCYEIDGEPMPLEAVTMTDQFGPHLYTGLTPELLCTPAVKMVGEDTFEPELPDLDLKCYTVEGLDNVNLFLGFQDQFAGLLGGGFSSVVNLADEDKICVEVEKTIVHFEVEKFYTHTDVDWEPICEGVVNPADDLCYVDGGFGEQKDFTPVTFDENNFGTPLDGGDPFTIDAVVHPKNDKVRSYNPGQYYAVTKVTLNAPIDEISIWEDFVDCTDRNQSGDKNNNVAAVSIVNPKKAPGGAAIVVVNPNGDVLDLSDELADSGQLFFDDKDSDGVIDIGHAGEVLDGTTEALTGVDAIFDEETMIYMYVKFKPGLKGENFLTLLSEFKTCENWETVEVTIGEADPIEKLAHATLNVVPKE